MDDEDTVKVAPVTRLRRRLSVELTDEAKSSSAPNTPTKKRGGRRAAKPELDLIDENAPENGTPKNLPRKTNLKDIDVEEKPVTPSRRSTRIKSNSSIVLETTQTIDSPRTKRATRRASQAGSDNEAPVTPARLTRRARKDSTKTDKAEPPSTSKAIVPITELPIAEVIVEEADTSSQNIHNNSDIPIEHRESPSGFRKSPRLSLKKNKSSSAMESKPSVDVSTEPQSTNKSVDPVVEINEKELKVSLQKLPSNNNINKSIDQNQSPSRKSPRLSLNKSKINREKEAENYDNEPKKLETYKANESTATNEQEMCKSEELNNSNKENESSNEKFAINVSSEIKSSRSSHITKINVSSSAVLDMPTHSTKHKRQRTKSWSTPSNLVENNNKDDYSDSECMKKNKRLSNNFKELNLSSHSEKGFDVSVNKNKKGMLDISVDKAHKDVVDSPNRKSKLLSPSEKNISNTTTLFEKKPDNMQVSVYIEESDSNPDKIRNHREDEDQCVPIIQTHLVSQEIPPQSEIKPNIFNLGPQNNKSYTENEIGNENVSCEPMDVDETLPDNVISRKSLLETQNLTANKINMNSSGYERDTNKRSLLNAKSPQVLDKTSNENKSTLVLSHIKDISNENHDLQSPKLTTETKMPNSEDVLNVTQDKLGKDKLAPNYSTSTPLLQKGLIKHVIQVNTSGITSNNTSNIDKSSNSSQLKINKSRNSSDHNSESDNEESEGKGSFILDEAEEASDDYESGDSKDEEEELYEKENEIVEKGETLSSEEDLSNDTDYEKDSFVVSSDGEDNELLSGSGDDLNMSDNELTMSSKSKKKYDERKKKEQNLASRQMYESRHKLSSKSKESELTKVKKNRAVIESSDSENEDIKVTNKKKKRLRLDSSHEVSMNKSSEKNSGTPENKSLSESRIEEVEMTVIADNMTEENDPLENIKSEPKTPQKEVTNKSIQFIDPEDSDKIDNVGNKSQIIDPLDEADSSQSSDSSDNVHIQNYDCILNDLNESMKTRKDKGNMSLNLNKKNKKKSERIVDQLNLTEIKSKKKNDNSEVENSYTSLNDQSNKSLSKNVSNRGKDNKLSEENKSQNDALNQSVSKKVLHNKQRDHNSSLNSIPKISNNENNENSDIESSDSIDLHLLFSEDSNNSEDANANPKINELSNKDDNFIPLKVQGKTDILEISGCSVAPTESASKKNKNHKVNKLEDKSNDIVDGPELQFFVDTTGSYKNASKKKKGNISTVEDEGATDKSMNRSVIKTPKSEKKKNKRISESHAEEQKGEKSDSDIFIETTNKKVLEAQEKHNDVNVIDKSLISQNKSLTRTPKSDKKKKRMSETPVTEQAGEADKLIEECVVKTPKSDKKKRKRMSESQAEEQKCKNSDSDAPIEVTKNIAPETDTKDIEQLINTDLNKTTTKSPKVHKKNSLSESQQMEQIDENSDPDAPIEVKNKNETEAQENHMNIYNDSSLNAKNIPLTKNKSNKKKSKQIAPVDKLMNESDIKAPTSDKKKSKKLSESLLEEKHHALFTGNITETAEEFVSSKKRKRKSSLNQMNQKPDVEGSHNTSKPNIDVSVAFNNKNKKRKISHNIDNSENLDQDLSSSKNKTKKRKEREDDEGSKLEKVVTLDNEIQVPRLPKSLLNKLEEKPKKNLKVTKSKVISTTNFIVEESKAKRIKPSNYLEESIYLNDEETTESKRLKHIKNPKVLPFLPTVSSSNSGYTTNFKVNVLPKEIKFVAKSSNINNFKNDYLENKKLKRLGTYDLYKRNRNIKMSKF